ncbi:hypothetical protein [Streptomyces sp. SID3343]|uniref:hypothetical protein n=1 Tax=Streptomyces sp. SID3343 TaxID=2690260 RepID=UPI00136F51F1|nr:hypothetical protein [Streptomyces sp. SID3343]MYW05628.1 hypothetical protein [Streptomyces sp. SID3343]
MITDMERILTVLTLDIPAVRTVAVTLLLDTEHDDDFLPRATRPVRGVAGRRHRSVTTWEMVNDIGEPRQQSRFSTGPDIRAATVGWWWSARA